MAGEGDKEDITNEIEMKKEIIYVVIAVYVMCWDYSECARDSLKDVSSLYFW